MFDALVPWQYGWHFEEADGSNRENAKSICALAECLYQFGRGVDMAWAWGEILTEAEFEMRLASYPGRVHRPSVGGPGRTLPCPQPGSLQSLKDRYAAYSRRFGVEGSGKDAKRTFTQPPKARFAQVAYDSPSGRRVYELHRGASETAFAAWPLAHASALVEKARDAAAGRLRTAMPERSAEIERAMIGRRADGSNDGPISARVWIVPLASIGHAHADCGIRRVMVDVPADCALRGDDVHWAFSGLDLDERVDPETGEVSGLVLVRSSDEGMLSHYTSPEPGRRVWRTVSPAALPNSAARRRIEPTRRLAEAKAGAERADEQTRAASAVVQSLRHVGVRNQVESIRVQREPFASHGERAEEFAPGTRFVKERLWHAEIVFRDPITGPLVVGDGRFLGLGVMAPVQALQGIFAFRIEAGLDPSASPAEVTRALRRALMARVQGVIGERKTLPIFFSGHESDGSPAKSEVQSHLACQFDPGASRLLIIAPHLLDRREATREESAHLRTLEEALQDFRELRAGVAGALALRPCLVDSDTDPILASSREWETVTPYLVTRHAKNVGAAEALSLDVRMECRRRGLPEPSVAPRDLHGRPGTGLEGGAHLTFAVAVPGPIIIGRSRHSGGGLFAALPNAQ
jgi:CRISPR-associated protein Csb2